MVELRLWPANTLPIPRNAAFQVADAVKDRQNIITDDKFPKGRITKYFAFQGCGYMEDRVGRNIFFSLLEAELIGPKDREFIKEGTIVGYDLSHSGSGLHVKRMKIY